MGGGPPGLLIFLWNQRFTKIVISEGKMTEEQTANKERPVSFGGLSKTRYPVHNETSWKLLREASNHKIQGASIPENIWKLCKAAKQTLEHWCAWLQSSMEAVHTQKGMDWEWCSCRSWAEFCSFLLFTMQTSKRSSPRPPASPCACVISLQPWLPLHKPHIHRMLAEGPMVAHCLLCVLWKQCCWGCFLNAFP